MKEQNVKCSNAFELRELLNTIPDDELKQIELLVDEDEEQPIGVITAECYEKQITIVGPHL